MGAGAWKIWHGTHTHTDVIMYTNSCIVWMFSARTKCSVLFGERITFALFLLLLELQFMRWHFLSHTFVVPSNGMKCILWDSWGIHCMELSSTIKWMNMKSVTIAILTSTTCKISRETKNCICNESIKDQFCLLRLCWFDWRNLLCCDV